MKTKLRTYEEHFHSAPVAYKWHTGGSTHHATTVVLSKSKGGLRQALKRFWLQNSHVEPETV